MSKNPIRATGLQAHSIAALMGLREQGELFYGATVWRDDSGAIAVVLVPDDPEDHETIWVGDPVVGIFYSPDGTMLEDIRLLVVEDVDVERGAFFVQGAGFRRDDGTRWYGDLKGDGLLGCLRIMPATPQWLSLVGDREYIAKRNVVSKLGRVLWEKLDLLHLERIALMIEEVT